MSDALINACNALDAFATAVRDGWGGDQTFVEVWGWNCPPLTRHDMYDMVKRLSDRVRELSPEQINSELETKLSQVPQKLAQFQIQTLPHLYDGNASGAYPVFLATLNWVNNTVSPYLMPEVDWQDVEDQKLMPRALLRRLRSVDTQITNITSRSANLEDQIQIINDAHAAAEALPTDVASLNEAREAVEAARKVSEANQAKTEAAAEKAGNKVKTITDLEVEAKKLVENCEDAYSAATTKGLGEAFASRAKTLSRSMWVWVAGLLIALATGSWLGAQRVELLRSLMAAQEPNLGLIWINIILAFFSIAAPVWFAWIATKQIGQRFRLSEDYAFKASVAQAYEGYRREAARLDPQFAARLFGSALTRIEEAPLRFVEYETHGSPWHEVMSARFRQRQSSADPGVPKGDVELPDN